MCIKLTYYVHISYILCRVSQSINLYLVKTHQFQVVYMPNSERWPKFGLREPHYLSCCVQKVEPFWGDHTPEADPLNMRLVTWVAFGQSIKFHSRFQGICTAFSNHWYGSETMCKMRCPAKRRSRRFAAARSTPKPRSSKSNQSSDTHTDVSVPPLNSASIKASAWGPCSTYRSLGVFSATTRANCNYLSERGCQAFFYCFIFECLKF